MTAFASNRIVLFIASCVTLLFVSAANSRSECDRVERDIQYMGKPFRVRVSPDHWAEVIFPEKISGLLEETPTGLHIQQSGTNALPDRIFIQSDTTEYAGKVLVHDVKGGSYHFYAVGSDCADSTVTVHHEFTTDKKEVGDKPIDEVTHAKLRRKLIEYMMLDAKPPGYQVQRLEGPRSERLIGYQGSVYFYIEEIYRGGNYSGVVVLAENHGRVPFKVALQAIDYESPEIKDIFGQIYEVSMLPADFTLGPAPEYAVDQYNPTHQGLIFIVSKRVKRFNG